MSYAYNKRKKNKKPQPKTIVTLNAVEKRIKRFLLPNHLTKPYPKYGRYKYYICKPETPATDRGFDSASIFARKNGLLKPNEQVKS